MRVCVRVAQGSLLGPIAGDTITAIVAYCARRRRLAGGRGGAAGRLTPGGAGAAGAAGGAGDAPGAFPLSCRAAPHFGAHSREASDTQNGCEHPRALSSSVSRVGVACGRACHAGAAGLGGGAAGASGGSELLRTLHPASVPVAAAIRRVIDTLGSSAWRGRRVTRLLPHLAAAVDGERGAAAAG